MTPRKLLHWFIAHREQRRWEAELAHYYPHVYGLFSAAYIGSAYVTALYWPLQIATTVTAIAWCAAEMHKRRICPACARFTPLDTDAAVRDKGWALRLTHRRQRRAARYVPAVLLVVCVVATMRAPLVVPLLLGLILALHAVTDYAQTWHQRLYPWCPYCRHGRGRDDDDPHPIPEPTPEPENEREHA